MKKEYLIGGLVVLGGLALLAWYKKPKRNSDGFFSAGGSGKLVPRKRCYCQDSKNRIYLSNDDKCKGSDVCIATTGAY